MLTLTIEKSYAQPTTHEVDSVETLVAVLTDVSGHMVSVTSCAEEPRYTVLRDALLNACDVAYYSPILGGWQYRESNRFADCTYIGLPKSVVDLLTRSYGVELDHYHYLHRSTKGGDLIAYTENPTKGFLDKQKVQRLGAYLKEHHSDKLTDPQISGVVQLYRSQVEDDFGAEILLATSADDVLACYTPDLCAEAGNYDSCMLNHKFSSMPVKPCEVYANHPQLAVAYLKRDNEIVARALVRTDTKKWLRAYVTGKRCDVLAAFQYALKTAGYEEDARMLKGIVLPALGRDGNVMPYLDGSYQYVERCKDGWRIGSDGDSASETGGYVSDERETCADCESSFDSDDLTIIGNDQQVCNSCLDNYYSCDNCGRYTTTDDTISVRDGDSTVCERCAARLYTQCDDCAEWISNSDARSIDGDSYCETCVRDNFSACEGCDDMVKNEDLHTAEETNDYEERQLCSDCFDDFKSELDSAASADIAQPCEVPQPDAVLVEIPA